MIVWKKVRGFPYKISSRGELVRLARRDSRGNNLPERAIAVCANRRREARLYGGKTIRREYIAVLVLEAFVGRRPNAKSFACHKNDVEWDDRIENLKWGDKSSNAADAVRNGIAGKGSPAAAKISKALKGVAKTPEHTANISRGIARAWKDGAYA